MRSRPPRITRGVQSGDVQPAALIWARCDEPARRVVEWDTGAMLGAEQARWLADAVAGSRALEDHRGRSAGRPGDRRRTRQLARRGLTVALRGIDGRERYRVELPHA